MERITSTTYPSFNGNDFKTPAGVSVIFVQIMDGTTALSQVKSLSVVPNTTYSITINSASYNYNLANTLGSLFSWTGSGQLKISWLE